MEVTLFMKPAVQEERKVAAEHSTVGDEEIMKAAATGQKLGGDQASTGNSNLQRSTSSDQKDSILKTQVSLTFSSEFASVMDSTSSRPPSNAKDSSAICQGDQLESTKAEMGEIREENERLKMILSRIAKDYKSLQMHYFDIVQQEQAKKRVDQPRLPSPNNSEDESELVSLSLGTSSRTANKKEDKASATNKAIKDRKNKLEEGLSLGLDCKYEGSGNSSLNETVSNRSPDDSSDQETTKEEEPAGEAWPPSKVLKSLRNGDDEIAQQPQVKKARVSIRARCDAPTMNDGCQWRKYGQKVAKGNPCPRAYYRCTVAPSCPVRKQVQRCAEDMSILITTYEGTHNHPLPVSATAMASTTSAAASMLLAGSSSSQPMALDSLTSSSTSSTSNNAALHGLNFSLSDTSRTRAPLYQLPNTSISSTPSYPTITLDLTAPQSSGSSHANQFTRFSTSFANTAAPRYTSTSFNFSSSDTTSLPISWSNGSSYLSYGSSSSSSQQYNKSPMGALSLSRLSQEPFCQSFLQRASTNVPAVDGSSNNRAFTDTIAKALTSDPSFQSALAEAITSYVGAHGAQSNAPSSTPGNACAASFLNRSTSSSGNSQLQGSTLCIQRPSLAFPGSKSASSSPVDHHRENTN